MNSIDIKEVSRVELEKHIVELQNAFIEENAIAKENDVVLVFYKDGTKIKACVYSVEFSKYIYEPSFRDKNRICYFLRAFKKSGGVVSMNLNFKGIIGIEKIGDVYGFM